MALNIYLADLVYNTIKTNYVVPLNIGYIAASLKEKFGQEVNISLFKYPEILEKALRENPPDILGLSHYSWNTRLDLFFLDMVKRLNPKTITVMGGPDIRIEHQEIQKFLVNHQNLDYYIVHEGEEPFVRLIGEFLGGCPKPHPLGCATIIDREFFYVFEPFNEKSREINQPSPYLTGFMDQFLTNPSMTPLLETNRGCPFSCAYCAWGIAALKKIRVRPLDQVFEEINYVAEKSVGQVSWIFCDANFGILPRDIEIARKIREVMDRKGYPINVILWHSKNTSKRNLELAEIIGNNNKRLIAIQSADPEVLANVGRGGVKMSDVKEELNGCHEKNLEVATDILIGLPGESTKSHLNTLIAAFDMGFDYIEPINIRLLRGSRYESDEFRERYKIKTKYRPIFGAYGTYDNKLVFETEESVRATKDMSEEELNNFKIHHWLIYFIWDIGILKPILLLGRRKGINPAVIIDKLSKTKHPVLKKFFERIKEESMKEWFETQEKMVSFYEQPQNFNNLVNNFMKLNFLYIALAYQDQEFIQALQEEMENILTQEFKARNIYNQDIIDNIIEFSNLLICKDLLQNESRIIAKYPGEIVSIMIGDPKLAGKGSVELEIYRPQEFVSFCRFHLNPDGENNLSLKNIVRFLEAGGMSMLKNKVNVLLNNRYPGDFLVR